MNPEIENNIEFLTAEKARALALKAQSRIKFDHMLNEIHQKAHNGNFSIVLHIEPSLKEDLIAFLKDRGFFVPSEQNADDSVAAFWKSPGVSKEEYNIDAYKMFNEAINALKENQLRLKGQIDEKIERGDLSLTVGDHMVPPETKKKLEKDHYRLTHDNESASYTIEW